MGSTRNCCFTWNNPDNVERVLSKLQAWKSITFGVYGEETGEVLATPHLQGYLEFKSPVLWTTVNNKLEKNHSEGRHGTALQATNYCLKGSQTKEEWALLKELGPTFGKDYKGAQWGTMTQQGARNDLTPACEMLKEGASMKAVAEEHPTTFVKYHKGLVALKSILINPRSAVPEVRVFVGATGTGKSRYAREWLEGEHMYVWHPQCGNWFDGYEGQKHVLFEEFRGQLPYGHLLSLIDRYDCKVQYKGGIIEFCAIKIAFTSPKEPRMWYKDLEEDDRIEQLMRRISSIQHTEKLNNKRKLFLTDFEFDTDRK